MDWLGSWGVAVGAAWLSGVKLYASVLTLGLLQPFGLPASRLAAYHWPMVGHLSSWAASFS
jgi:hypothetical protein